VASALRHASELSREIGDCYGRAEECKRLAATALTDDSKAGFLDMEPPQLRICGAAV
jgi:hypothetical protein